jgi:hypothetical protein
MNIYRNKKTGAIIEIPSEFGSNDVWEKVNKPSSEPVVEKVEKEVKAPAKKTTRKVSTK